MPKPKWNLNTVYISERLQESLRPVSRCTLTTVVAPMGYGKTTAVNWYLEARARLEPVKMIRVSVYSDNLAIFWKSVQDAFARAGFGFMRDCDCPEDAASGGLLARAISDAEADDFVMPFAENFRYLRPLLSERPHSDFTARISELGEAMERRLNKNARPAALAALTERECETVGLMAQRLSNREIAERLYLSEGSVKQYVKQIYSKLHIEGDTRTKRSRLSELLAEKN